jgi:hypothetical protein
VEPSVVDRDCSRAVRDPDMTFQFDENPGS